MTVIKGLENLTAKHPYPVITLGNFDGVHLGHQALFNLVQEKAKQAGGTSMVLTFEPHPLRILSKGREVSLITPFEQKIELIENSGIDLIICLDFTPELARIEPVAFVRDILVDLLGVKEIVIGYDFRFGHKGLGNRDLLIEMGREHGFAVETVGPMSDADDMVISSTRTRELIQSGQVDRMPAMLGRYYGVVGKVIRGHNRGGRLLGFPTANLELVDGIVPKIGVYAVRVLMDNQAYDGVANVGYNPTFGDAALSIEVHFFDFDQEIYGRTLKVDFVAGIRGEKKFSGPEELTAQIKNDCEVARQILSEIEI
jgi:riboflavin kinase/FMN adenylyltransferase